MKFVTIDTETSIKNRGEGAVGDFKASPFCKANKIVRLGYARGFEEKTRTCVPIAHQFTFSTPSLLVGHNIGFDILHMMKDGLIKESHFPNMFIWDTQQVEYLLSGQRHTYPSLDECCAARGLPLKDDKIKDYWNNDIDTEMIPKEELDAYLVGDVENTRAIFLDQWATVSSNPALMELVRVKMEDKLATIWMEWNGMEFDLVTASFQLDELKEERWKYVYEIIAETKTWWPTHLLGLPDTAKTEHVSAMLYGGKIKYEFLEVLKDEEGKDVRYKTGVKKGEAKTRKAIAFAEVVPSNPCYGGVGAKKSGVFKVDDETLESLGTKNKIAGLVREIRTLTKDITTYYEGYASLVWPDGKIHPSFNHEATGTGRQSCTKPNLQNVTKTDDD